MGIFNKVKSTDKVEAAKDTVGGYTVHETAVYPAKLARMYAHTADSGSIGVTLELDLFTNPDSEETKRMTKTLYVTNSEGKNYYEDKNGKNQMNTNWLMADAIAVFATNGEAGLGELETEEIFIKRTRDGAEVTEPVEAYPEVAGLDLNVAIMKVEGPKQKKVDGKWKDTDEIQLTNEIDRIFNEEGFTLLEWEAGTLDEPEFINKWEKEWKGKTKKVKPKASTTSERTGGSRTAARGGATRTPAARTGRPARFTK